MLELSIILSLFFFCLFSFFEIIIFNEEILLTLCFMSFLFYCFNNLSESVAASFESRAAKFEDELLTTFNNSKNILITEFSKNVKTKSFMLKLEILMVTIVSYLTVSSNYFTYKTS